MAKKDCTVLILHGHGRTWETVRHYVQESGYTALILKERVGGGVLFEKFRKAVWKEAHCAIVVMTRDDMVGSGEHASYRARQNVVFELGYCFGAFDSLAKRSGYKAEQAVIVVEEEGVERFANIEGLVSIRFPEGNVAAVRTEIESALKDAYKRARKFYRL